jgi:hypothetical protein
VVVVLFGQDGGPLVDVVDEALGGPRHVELGLFDLAGRTPIARDRGPNDDRSVNQPTAPPHVLELPSFYVDAAQISRHPFTVQVVLGKLEMGSRAAPSLH